MAQTHEDRFDQKIHPTAIVHPGARIGKGVSVGPYSIIEEDVVIGDGTRISSHARVEQYTLLGEGCSVHHGAVVGTIPQDLKFQGEVTTLEIGDRTVIREFTTLNRGTSAHGKTSIGHDSLLMAYVHIAHDCIIGNHVILSNSSQLGGHVEIEDYANVSSLVAIHQFVKIGSYAMVGGGSKVSKDICPFIKVARDPLKPVALNTIGLRRRGFAEDTIRILKHAYRILFRSNLNISQAVERIERNAAPSVGIDMLMTFIRESGLRTRERGRGLLS